MGHVWWLLVWCGGLNRFYGCDVVEVGSGPKGPSEGCKLFGEVPRLKPWLTFHGLEWRLRVLNESDGSVPQGLKPSFIYFA
jgi:hypothetical protein